MSNVNEILKLKELLDKEIITKEEFELKKKELLCDESKKTNKDKNKTMPKKEINVMSGCLSAIIIAFIIFGMLVIEPSNDKYYNNKNVIESFVTSYDDFSNIIELCGFSNYTLEKDDLLDNLDGEGTIGFRIKTGNVNGIVYIKDGVIYSVKYADNYLYKDGSVQHTLSEYTITSDEKIILVSRTQEIINGILKSPSTAKYPLYDSWAVGKENGSTIVQGYVDSQNSFGAVVRSTFQVTYTNNTVTSLIFDGIEYMK